MHVSGQARAAARKGGGLKKPKRCLVDLPFNVCLLACFDCCSLPPSLVHHLYIRNASSKMVHIASSHYEYGITSRSSIYAAPFDQCIPHTSPCINWPNTCSRSFGFLIKCVGPSNSIASSNVWEPDLMHLLCQSTINSHWEVQ